MICAVEERSSVSVPLDVGSGCNDADPTGLPRAGLSPNHDLDVLVDRRQQVHQALDREARQLIVTKGRDLRLRHAQHFGGIGLRELALFKHLIQGISQAQLDLTLGGVWKPEIREHVRGAASDRFSSFSVSPCQ
jgi:hypothetical protein